MSAAFKVINSGDSKLEKLTLSSSGRACPAGLRNELVLVPHGEGALTNLFKNMQGCTTTEFEDAAMAKRPTKRAAREYLTTGVANNRIVYDKGTRNARYYRFADCSPFASLGRWRNGSVTSKQQNAAYIPAHSGTFSILLGINEIQVSQR